MRASSGAGNAVPLTGVVLTKLDGDARGGAALSVKAVTGKPIKLASVGEKLDVPPRRPAAPHGDEPRGIERIDHQNDDRQVKEGKP